jgi:acetyltransferase-like isoleucine patch superfamily enzyme
VAIGDNGVRRSFAEQLEAVGYELVNAIHPSANIARNVSLGSNIVVAAGALVCAHGQIGDSVILNTGCIVDHETLIGTASHICPGRIAGRVVRVGCRRHRRDDHQSVRRIRAVVGAGRWHLDVAPMSTVVGRIKLRCTAEDMQHWMMPELLRDMPVAPASVR